MCQYLTILKFLLLSLLTKNEKKVFQVCGLGLWAKKKVNNGMNGFEKTDEFMMLGKQTLVLFFFSSSMILISTHILFPGLVKLPDSPISGLGSGCSNFPAFYRCLLCFVFCYVQMQW